jgi:hypothetical protein
LIFPILTLVFTFVIMLLFIAPVVFQRTGYHVTQAEHWAAVGKSLVAENAAAASRPGKTGDNANYSLRPIMLVYGGLIYFVSMFLATFFNVAFYSEIMGALRGNPVSIPRGLAFACGKWRVILLWTLFAGIIGLIIRAIEERLEFLGRFIVGLIGTAWSVACVFVIPVLVCEEETVNPLLILKKSAVTLRKTWGESLIGYAGIRFGGALVSVASLLWLGGAVALSISLKSYWLIGGAMALWVAAMIALSYVTSVASQVYRCALFLYASEGTIPPPYNQDLLNMAWKMKKA